MERLHRGTYFGHIVEHVALALSVAAGINVSYGKTVSTDDERVYRVVVRYRSEPAMRYLLEAAVGLVDAVLAGSAVDVAEIIATAKRILARHAMGPSTQAIVDAADAREIPWQRIGETGSLIRLGWGRNIQWIKTGGQQLHHADRSGERTGQGVKRSSCCVRRGWPFLVALLFTRLRKRLPRWPS